MTRRFGWAGAFRAAGVVCALLLALCLRGLAADAGFPIPGLPLSSFGGSGADNLLAVIFVLLAFVLLRPWRGAPPAATLMGLRAPRLLNPLLVLVCTLPFWVASALTGTLSTDIDLHALLFTALLFPLAEEVVFRGFGFAFPVLGLHWRRWIAALGQALCFGAIHWLSQHENGSDQAGTIFCMTFLGGLVFAMLDSLDRFTIWSGLVFHVSLNAAWGVFDSGGWGWLDNGMRLFCAALALGVLWYRRRTDDVLPTPEAAS